MPTKNDKEDSEDILALGLVLSFGLVSGLLLDLLLGLFFGLVFGFVFILLFGFVLVLDLDTIYYKKYAPYFVLFYLIGAILGGVIRVQQNTITSLQGSTVTTTVTSVPTTTTTIAPTYNTSYETNYSVIDGHSYQVTSKMIINITSVPKTVDGVQGNYTWCGYAYLTTKNITNPQSKAVISRYCPSKLRCIFQLASEINLTTGKLTTITNSTLLKLISNESKLKC